MICFRPEGPAATSEGRMPLVGCSINKAPQGATDAALIERRMICFRPEGPAATSEGRMPLVGCSINKAPQGATDAALNKDYFIKIILFTTKGIYRHIQYHTVEEFLYIHL
jgi:hypothetical protein